MSLINAMLSDLDARRPDRRAGHDFALDGLEPVRATVSGADTAAALRLILLAALIGGSAACAAWFALQWLEAPRTWQAEPAPRPLTPPNPPAGDSTASAEVSAPVPDVSLLSLPVAPDGFVPQGAEPLERLGYAAAAARAEDELAASFLPDEGHDLAAPRLVTEVGEVTHEPAPGVEASHSPAVSAPVEFTGTIRKEARIAETEPAALLREALERTRYGQAADVVPALARLTRRFPGYVPAQEAYATALLRQGERGAAERALRGALAAEPRAARLAMMLAHLLVERDRVDGALAALRKAAPGAASDPEYHAFIAALEQRAGRHALAIASYREVLAQAPQRGVWWMGLAISLAANGAPEDARQAFERALIDNALSEKLRRYATAELSRLSGST